MRISVQGIGPFGCFGAGAGDLEALLTGTRVVPPEIDKIERDGNIFELPWFKARTSKLEAFIPRKKLRRIDRFSTMALLGAHLAIADAGVGPEDLENTGIIVATGYGASGTTFSFLDSFLNKGDRLSVPTHFSNSVHNAAAAHITVLLGIKGPCLTVSQFDLSVASALFTAVSWLQEERVTSVLVGGVDEYNPVVGYATAGLNAESPDPSTIAGEGGCFFLLSREDTNNGAGYGYLTEVDMVAQDKAPRPSNTHPVIVGSQGYGGCHGKDYGVDDSDLSHDSFLCYDSLYGKFPAAAAIDLGAACLCLKNRHLFPPPQGTGMDKSTISAVLKGIHCLSPGNDTLWGAVTLASKYLL
ncbi:MAG: beta-ketoacyl synthase chain length factor [Desulfobacterium sp.]|nr:beta-ketoacyl synthase chain length factor [Desulfobacterium sp.]